MSTEEGRARFLSQAKPLVVQIEAPALGAMIRKRLAEMAGLEPGELPGYIPPRVQGRPSQPPAPRAVRRSPSLEGQILERVLRRPALARTVDPDLVGNRRRKRCTRCSPAPRANSRWRATEDDRILDE
jgi:DNA primase